MSKKPASPTSTIAPGTSLTRGFAVERAAINTEARTVELAFASETPYERWWGIEILECSPTAMRMGRLTSGGPLLADHDTRDQIGVIESVQIGADRVVRAVVRFGKGERAEEMFRDVVDGIRRNVSVGYQIHKAVLVEENDDIGTYRATDWEPYEVSLVSVPADTSVGIGRSARAADDVSPLIPLVTKEAIMTNPEVVPAPAVVPAATAISSADVQTQLKAERTRISEMLAIGDQFARYNGVALAKEAVEKGESIEALRAKVMNAMTSAQTTQVTNLDLSPKEQKRFSMFKAIRAMQGRDGDSWERTAGFEWECHREILKRVGLETSVHGGFYVPMDIQKRDLTVGTPTAGGNLVATNLVPSSFIDLLRARSRAAQLGATMLPGLVGNVTIPKLTGAATGYWLANEATAITESQQTIGQLALAPKTLGAYTELSRQLMMQSTPAAEQLVMDDLAKVMALAIDLAVFEGSGSSGQPSGISVTAGIGSVTGGSLDLADCIEFQTDLAAGNALVDGCAYITTPAVAGLLKGRARIASTDSVTLWSGSVLDGTIEGFRATTSTQLTAASMIFGDFSQVVVAEWGMLEIALNPYAAFPTAITGIRAIQSVDIGIRQAAAFSRATSIS